MIKQVRKKRSIVSNVKIGQDMFKNDQIFAIVKLVHDKLI